MVAKSVKSVYTRYGHFLWLAICVFVFVTVCSTSSFLYPMNTWCDANCFFTVGKAMANGKILYKDIYEQKGLYLYVLYAIAYGISQQSFIGAYLLELAFGFAFACAVYRLLILYIRKDAALVLTPVLLFLSYTPQSFSQGGSAEEFVQPLMAWALWFLLSGVKKRNASMLLRHYALAGVFAAFAFWIKFTMCGFFFAFILVAFLFELRNKNVRRAFTGAGVFAGGMVGASLPALIYFAANGALGDMFTAYIYNNIFLYANRTAGAGASVWGKLWGILRSYLLSFGFGWQFYTAILPGFVYFAISKRVSGKEKAALFALYGGTVIFTFAGGVGYRYYGQPVCIFAFTGGVALCRLMGDNTRVVKRDVFACGAAAILAVTVALSLHLCPNVSAMGRDKNDLVQYKFARIINETPNATSLDYLSLDTGVYTAAGIVPTCKYFCGLNIPLDDIAQTQNRWVAEGKTDYIVAYNVIPERWEEKYELLTMKDGYRLYGLKERKRK